MENKVTFENKTKNQNVQAVSFILVVIDLVLQVYVSSLHPPSTLTCCVGETPDEWDLYP